jgi:hypothetical protein
MGVRWAREVGVKCSVFSEVFCVEQKWFSLFKYFKCVVEVQELQNKCKL